MSDALYEKVIYENVDKNYQYRLTVNEFRDVQYLHIRKYFQSYEGDFVPSKEGASIAATIGNTFSLLDGLIDIVSREEAIDVITKYFGDKIIDLNKRNQSGIITS